MVSSSGNEKRPASMRMENEKKLHVKIDKGIEDPGLGTNCMWQL